MDLPASALPDFGEASWTRTVAQMDRRTISSGKSPA
jgi:hypothetical protein